MKNKFYIIIVFMIFIFSCNKLKITNFNNENNDATNLDLLTSNFNYQRNTLSSEEISPPLELIFEDDYNGLPVNGFSFIDSILFFGTGKGYLIAINVNNQEQLGKKKFGLSASAPPTIYRNILYQTYDNGNYGLIVYDIIEGDKLWEIENNLTSSSAIVLENKVFFQNNKGKVYCLNYLNGEIIWTSDLNCFGVNSIAYDNGKIISANQDGAIYALEYTSGVILWKKILDDQIFANPVINEDYVYISTYKGNLYKLNIEDGIIVQFKEFRYPLYYGISVDNNNIYIPISDGELKTLDKINFIELWSNKGSGPAASSVVVSENYLYFPTLGKHLYILDKKTGVKLQKIELEGRARSTPIIRNGKLIIACEDDNVNIFASSK
jgi:outer membrane protein assembly factor BamB